MTDREALLLCYSALNWCVGQIEGLGGHDGYPKQEAEKIKKYLEKV